MKNILIALVALIVLAGALFVYDYYASDEVSEVPSEPGMAAGVVTSVNLDSVAFDWPGLVTIQSENGETHTIAIPSMGILLCEASPNIADVFRVEVGDRVEVNGEMNEMGEIVPCESVNHYLRVHTTHTDAGVSLQFDYRKGPDGYLLQDLEFDPAPSLSDPQFVKGYRLILASDQAELDASEGPREGPPTMTIQVYRNIDRQSASVWVDTHASFSNIGLLVGEADRDAVLAGANAVQYQTDGLYRNDNVVVAHSNFMYLFSGAFLDADSMIRRDFSSLLDSVEFIRGTEES